VGPPKEEAPLPPICSVHNTNSIANTPLPRPLIEAINAKSPNSLKNKKLGLPRGRILSVVVIVGSVGPPFTAGFVYP
jgi:hypothetical protein